MNYCDRISNQTVIDYSQGKYGRQLSCRHSSPDLRPPKKQTDKSTKSWVVRSFYSHKSRIAKSNPTPVVAASPKLSPAVTTKRRISADNSRTYSPREVISSDNPKPAVFFDRSLINFHAEKFKFCLVGKFPGWRPSLAQIREWVSTKWKLHGCWSVTLLDHRHVFIRLDNEADMLYVWTRNRWFVDGHLMKVFKWFPTFRPSSDEGEPSSAAVWVSLPRLPLIFFEEELLFRIAALVGKVFTMDVSTRSLSRPNVARVCVEVDLLTELPRQVWIGSGDRGYWQDLLYGKLPSYCTRCRQQGHSTQFCRASTSASIDNVVKLKSTLENPNSGAETQGYSVNSSRRFSRGKRFHIGPVTRNNDENFTSPETPLKLSGRFSTEVEKLVHRNCRGGEGSANRGECSSAPTVEQPVRVDGIGGEGIGASNKAGELQGAVLNPDISWKAFDSPPSEPESEDITKAFDPEVQGNVFSGLSKRRGSFRRAVHRSPPRRKRRSLLFWKIKRKKSPGAGDMQWHVVEYTYSDVKKMTKSFSEKIGSGGFGPVYKGVLLDGRTVAVKVSENMDSLFPRDRAFLAEIKNLPNISHINVIRLLGFCSEGTHRALVYEFMPNGSLEHFIHSSPGSPYPGPRLALPSKTLLSIAVGVAQGLDYLQNWCHLTTVHLDIKPSNILLDKNFCPKITDFGLSRRMSQSWSMTLVRGTMGYIAPEFFNCHRVSKKADVISYGVMLLEMVLRKKPYDDARFENDPLEARLVDWVGNRVTPRGEIPGVAGEEIERKMIMVGLSCAQVNPQNRPSFVEIIDMLKRSVEDLSVPQKPSLFLPLDPFLPTAEGDADATGENTTTKKTKKIPVQNDP